MFPPKKNARFWKISRNFNRISRKFPWFWSPSFGPPFYEIPGFPSLKSTKSVDFILLTSTPVNSRLPRKCKIYPRFSQDFPDSIARYPSSIIQTDCKTVAIDFKTFDGSSRHTDKSVLPSDNSPILPSYPSEIALVEVGSILFYWAISASVRIENMRSGLSRL